MRWLSLLFNKEKVGESDREPHTRAMGSKNKRAHRGGERKRKILDAISKFDGEFTTIEIAKASGYTQSCGHTGIATYLREFEKKGLIECVTVGKRRRCDPLVWRKKTAAKQALVSKPVTVPFYYEAEFRVVAKRDKRIITLIEQKKTDALGNEKWEPAETNVRLYQQALKAVCGHILAQNGVL